MVGQYLIPFLIHDKKIVDYECLNGKIYLVKCKYNKDLIYAGSTKKTLEERMWNHRGTTKKQATSLYDVVCGDWDNWYIELYENYPCYNKYQLRRREGEVIKQIATINKVIAGRTRKEHYQDNREKIIEQNKEYYQNNRDNMLEKMKDHYQDNREKIIEQNKKYYQNNKDEILEQKKVYSQNNRDKIAEKDKKYYQNNRDDLLEKSKEYYHNNRDEINEKRAEKITCNICGSISTKSHLKRHQRSKKCKSVQS